MPPGSRISRGSNRNDIGLNKDSQKGRRELYQRQGQEQGRRVAEPVSSASTPVSVGRVCERCERERKDDAGEMMSNDCGRCWLGR